MMFDMVGGYYSLEPPHLDDSNVCPQPKSCVICPQGPLMEINTILFYSILFYSILFYALPYVILSAYTNGKYSAGTDIMYGQYREAQQNNHLGTPIINCNN